MMLRVSIMRAWVTAVTLSLQATLSLANDNPVAVTRANSPSPDMVNMDSVLLGRDLFYDPILSGNRNIACSTCHHPRFGSGDGMSLSLGEGGIGLGPDRVILRGAEPHARIPRNAPALWNLGEKEFTVMFHDGRVEIDETAPFGIKMPAGRELERALPSALAAQTILPLQSPDEMSGQSGENPVADAVAADHIRGPGGAWDLLARRIESLPEYRARFYALNGNQPLHITDIAMVLADFISVEFSAKKSPYDAFLMGNSGALTDAQKRGLALFQDKAGCAACHSGTFQTDHGFHAIGVPQIGPGKQPNMAGYADRGRQYVSGDPDDRYRFRTPSLRNIALTAPYGHSGAYPTLEAMLRHHLNPMEGLMRYNRAQVRLHSVNFDADDWGALEDQEELLNIAEGIELPPITLTDAEIADLLSFLNALTDTESDKTRLGVPESVPSDLPVEN